MRRWCKTGRGTPFESKTCERQVRTTMKKKTMKRLMSWVLAAAMVVAMLPVSVLGATVEGNVAKIGEMEYATLDAAIAAAEDGAIIELLGDATTEGMNLQKNLTITAAADLTQKPDLTFDNEGIAIWGKALTFRNIDVIMNGIGATPYVEWKWMSVCASKDASLTLDNVNMTMDATGASSSPHAIYFCKNNILNIVNGSNLTIKNYPNDALEWDGGDGGYNVNITDSTFVSDHNRSGFTGTFVATITNSKVDVINSAGNGSNGSHFTIEDSDVNFSDNGSHGLSAGNLYISNSNVTANHNAYIGIAVNGEMKISESSVVTVTENAYDSLGYAAMRLYNDYPFTIDGTSELYIKDNSNTGLYVRQGQLTVSDGAYLEITGNQVTNNQLHGYGGGIYVGYGDNYDPTVVLPADAKIYNNHATNGGDDIYVSQGANGPSLTFGKVGSDWVLDDCKHLIDGWYLDGEDARWQVCGLAEGEKPYAVEYPLESETATVTGLTALKAAHGYDPVDKASYPGLDKKVGDDEAMNDDDVDAAAGQKVNFQLTSNVPTDLLNYLNPKDVTPPSIDGEEPGTAEKVGIAGRGEYVLTFHDKLNEKLINPENYVVKIGDTPLTEGQYTLTATDLEDGCSFEIALDLAALYEAGVITDADIKNATLITVTYDATLSADATAGTYENTAWVTAPDWETSKDIVYVNTYAIDIFKYDQADNTGLVGAEFELKNSEGVVISTVTSGQDGHVVIDGLDAGTYTLTETKAPDGYVKSNTPLTIVIPDDADETFTVNVNFANSQIPHTGGTGTLMFTIGGIVIIATAGVLLLVSRKKKKTDA